MKKIYAIILARGGSKGLNRKNIKKLNGISLLERTINDAKGSKFINKIIVSTEDQEIRAIAQNLDVDVMLRPNYLSKDNTTSDEVLQNIAEELKLNNDLPDIFVYLQLTEPFRPKKIIDNCIESLLNNPSLDSVFAGFVSHKNYWIKMNDQFVRISPAQESSIPRQNKKPVFREDTGLALAVKPEVFLSGRRIGDYPKIIPYDSFHSTIDIHTEIDLNFAELIEPFLLETE